VPALAVLTGSTLQGFANPNSDVDVFLVSTEPSAGADAPRSVAATGPVKVDLLWCDPTILRACPGAVASAPGPTRDSWHAHHEALGLLSRFGTGLAIAGTDSWLVWQQDEVPRLLRDALRTWWKSEAVRHLLLARSIGALDPFVAAQHVCDARLAALEVDAVDQPGTLPGWASQTTINTVSALEYNAVATLWVCCVRAGHAASARLVG
jgi:hypothetical protein